MLKALGLGRGYSYQNNPKNKKDASRASYNADPNKERKPFVSNIIESVDSISKDERGFSLTQYIRNRRISCGGYTFTHFKHHHRVLRLISYSMSV